MRVYNRLYRVCIKSLYGCDYSNSPLRSEIVRYCCHRGKIGILKQRSHVPLYCGDIGTKEQ